MDPLGDNDLVCRCRPTSCDLIPRQDLGAITLADPLDQGPPLGELVGRGALVARSAWASPHSCKQPIDYSNLVPSQLRTIA